MNKKVIIYGAIILGIGIGIGLYFAFKKPELTEDSFKEQIVVDETPYNGDDVPQLPDEEDATTSVEDSGSEEDDDYNSEYE